MVLHPQLLLLDGDRTQPSKDARFYNLRHYALEFFYKRFAHDDASGINSQALDQEGLYCLSRS
ncbi:MAG: hypothetical protein ACFB4I_11380 [Cyanophyceae cyanobacterium]